MIFCEQSAGQWRLRRDTLPLLEHTPERPFATALRREKSYAADRGTVKETVNEAERVPLTEVTVREDEIALTGGGHTLYLQFSLAGDTAELSFTGEDGWAYEFCLPALPGEAVFGGGEQYRKVNLRREHVVNFVSEHIKASTILEKTLLPRRMYREKGHADIGTYAPMPVFVTDRGRLFLFDTDADGISRFGDKGYTFTFDSCPRALVLSWGADYPALSRSLAERFPNRQYIPAWCHEGMILGVQGGTETVLKKAFAMLSAGAKVCGVWCQDWSGENRTVMGKQVWWNWEVDEKLYPDLKGATPWHCSCRNFPYRQSPCRPYNA